jgi:hypothetical protein
MYKNYSNSHSNKSPFGQYSYGGSFSNFNIYILNAFMRLFEIILRSDEYLEIKSKEEKELLYEIIKHIFE